MRLNVLPDILRTHARNTLCSFIRPRYPSRLWIRASSSFSVVIEPWTSPVACEHKDGLPVSYRFKVTASWYKRSRSPRMARKSPQGRWIRRFGSGTLILAPSYFHHSRATAESFARSHFHQTGLRLYQGHGIARFVCGTRPQARKCSHHSKTTRRLFCRSFSHPTVP
jgi:hypothetical protein